MQTCPESVDRPFDGNRVIILDENNRPRRVSEKGKVPISRDMLMDDHDIYRIEEKIRSLPCIRDVALVTVPLQGVNHVRCIFSTDQSSKQKFMRLIEKIKEQASTTGVINFSAHRVDKIPYSPSGKVRVGEIIRILNAA